MSPRIGNRECEGRGMAVAPCIVSADRSCPPRRPSIWSEAVYESATFPAVFRDNKNLSDIVLPKNITAVAKHVFSGSGLIRGARFGGCHLRRQYLCVVRFARERHVRRILPKITDAMFQGCPLTQVVLPAEVTTIGSNAFNGCKSLAKVTFGTKLKRSVPRRSVGVRR